MAPAEGGGSGPGLQNENPKIKPHMGIWVGTKTNIQRTVQIWIALLPLQTYHGEVCRLMKQKVIITSLQHASGNLRVLATALPFRTVYF